MPLSIERAGCALLPFPGLPHPAIAIHADVVRRSSHDLSLRFVITGDIGQVVVPAPIAPARKDGLWQSTCCEAFVRAGGPGYCEINLSPSTEWAAYAFDGYRSGMRDLAIAPPDNSFAMADGHMVLAADIALDPLLGGEWLLCLAAVIEDMAGNRSYWALAHAPEKPDFHHVACFALRVPAPTGP